MQQPNQPTTTVAILGADTVVGSALCALLEGSGYRISPIDSHPTGVADELLEGADLLLLAPRLDEGTTEAFLGAIGKSVRQRASVPVIALRTALEQAPIEEGVLSVPWPCETRALVERIEAALLSAPAAPADPCRATGRGVRVLGSIARPFVALGIVTCCDEADGLLARVMPRGK